MSIREESEGLLGTQIFWEDIQNDCFKLFGSDAKLGENKTIKDIADGKGFISRIGVVDNPWEDSTLAEQNGWPMKFVVKMATALQQEKYSKELEADIGTDKKIYDESDSENMAKMIKRLHNNECRLYEKLSGIEDLPLLKVYISYPFTDEDPNRGYLILEYVENIANLGNETFMDESLLLEILRTLAKYHSCSTLFSEEERKSMTIGIITDLFGTMLKAQFVDTVMDITAKFLGDEAGDSVDQLRKSILSIITPKYIEKMDNLAEVLKMERVLAHGDPWTCNVICTQEENGSIRLKKLIDLQTTHFGCAGHDLARLFSNVLNYQDRQEKADFYIEKYYEYLQSFWSGENLPYTKEQLINSYKAYLPLTSYVVAVSTAALGEMRSNLTKNPEETRQNLKKKVKDLCRNCEEAVQYLLD